MRHKIEEPDPIDIQIGQRIKLLRKVRGVSQRDLAKVLGLTFQQIQKYERGTNRISASNLYHVADHLDSAVEFFYYKSASVELPTDQRSMQFLKMFSNAPELVQTAVMKMLRVLSIEHEQANDHEENDSLVA